MSKLSIVCSLAGAGLALALFACGGSDPEPKKPARSAGKSSSSSSASSIITPVMLSIFAPLPPDYHKGEKPSAALVDLGRMLYYEARLSKSGKVSCNSCHQLDRFGTDGEKTSPGHDGKRGERNAPTSLNAAGQFAQCWDGRTATVEDQAKSHLLNPLEQGLESEAQCVSILKGIPGYVEAFGKAFPGQADSITFDNFAKAIGAFERGLVTPSRFDDFLGGKKDALTYAEQMGFKAFYDTGCHTCHMGPQLGAQTYDKLGKVLPWPEPVPDKGRSVVTKQASDDLMYKVPSLRNVTKTGPYFHDGNKADLAELVKLMGKYQLGKELGASDVASIIAFLATLEGRVDAEYTKKPQLP